MPYVNHGITWTHPSLGVRYSGKVGVRCTMCKHEDDVEQTYGHCLETGEPEDVVSLEAALRMVRVRLGSLGWDCSPDDDPFTADYCPECAQHARGWRH
jgi:hypothetical protein